MSRLRDSPGMCGLRASVASSSALLVAFLCLFSIVSAQGPRSRWLTLDGNSPLVIARGGFSGLFSDSSSPAYQLAMMTSLPNLVLWCDVQLTKDVVGICAPDIKLENSTDINQVYPGKDEVYLVNGVSTRGWFSVDFTSDELAQVILTQGVYSRSTRFDGNLFPIQTVESVAELKPSGLWLNIQHDMFFTQRNMSMINYVVSLSKKVVINYVSSPEVGFLRSIASRINPNITKLVFRFMKSTDIEPSTNQTYSSLLNNLTTIKTFASGILIPKDYIYPADASGYLQPYNSIVLDAHKAGLLVFASDFFNDVPLSYNYSYDPVSEYLSYIDNGNFSVDGVLSDFPITPSEAIDCFSHLGKNASENVELLVISKYGASGDYPPCTDLAYQKAISDGADVIDCPIQMSKDGVPFCFGSINLIEGTKVGQTNYSTLAMRIPELTTSSGIFTFNLTWEQIQTLKPQMVSPYGSKFELLRNPRFPTNVKLVSLSDFLALAKNTSSLTGVIISIENAPYLIEKQKLPVTDAVLKVLTDSGYDKKTAAKVMIQSTNSSVLMKFKDNNNYEIVYKIDEDIRDVLDSVVADIKKFADSVVVSKKSVLTERALFVTGVSQTVSKLQSAKLPVYVETFSNEFVSQAWDFFSDPTVEINSYVSVASINGVITNFPKTSARYKKNRCLVGNATPPYMSPVQPGSLIQLITSEYLPPAEAPNPVLEVSDVTESPLPSVVAGSPSSNPNGGGAAAPTPPNGQTRNVASGAAFFMSILTVLSSILLLL